MLKYKIPQIVTLTRNGYKILSFQTYKAVCLIPQVYRVSRSPPFSTSTIEDVSS